MQGNSFLSVLTNVISSLSDIHGGAFLPRGRSRESFYHRHLTQPQKIYEDGFILRSKATEPVQYAYSGHYDRTWRAEDGTLYYGVDNEDGTTDWYNEDGGPEGRTDTPSEDEQDENDSRNDGYDMQCHHCGGTGYDPIDGGQCEYCGGTGYLW